jgi:hypothetical protein
MARYIPRDCPKCGDYLGVVVPESKSPEINIDAVCLHCGYKLDWRILLTDQEDDLT